MSLRTTRRWAAVLGATLIATLGAIFVPTAASAAPVDTTCDYAETGGKYPTSICWIDWTAYNPTIASTSDGQDMTMPIGDYVVTYNIIERTLPGWSTRSLAASPVLGTLGASNYYGGIAGNPLLYSGVGTAYGAVSLEIRNFAITLDGTPVTGYNLVGASSETLDAFVGTQGEGLAIYSDQALTVIDHLPTFPGGGGCPIPPPGNGSTAVYCNGAAAGTTSAHGVIVSAPSATRIKGELYMYGRNEREAMSFGVMTSRIELAKQVDGRIDAADSFDVTATSSEGPVLGTATTGITDATTTESQVVIPSGPVSLSEAATSGTDTNLDYYDKDWSCTNTVTDSTTILPDGDGGALQAIDLQPGDDVSCVITNTALESSLSLTKTSDVDTAAAGDTVTYSFDVTNTGQVPVDALEINEGTFTGSGDLSDIVCPAAAIAPGGSATCEATYTVTQADVNAGSVSNTATAAAEVVGTSAEVVSTDSTVLVDTPGVGGLSVSKTVDSDSVAVGEDVTYTLTATNTGTLTLDDVNVVDEDFTGSGTLGAISCDSTVPATLIPGDSLVCTVTYTATSDDIGEIENSAVATGVDPASVTYEEFDNVSITVTEEPEESTSPTPTTSDDPIDTRPATAGPGTATPIAGENLASTGTAGLLGAILGGLLLAAGGAAAVIFGRRKARHAE